MSQVKLTLESILALRENSGTTDRWLALLIEWAEKADRWAEKANESLANKQKVINRAYDELYALPELNMSNYSEDQVSQLNEGVTSIVIWLEEHKK